MAKATVNKPEPVVTPPPTVTLELSVDEARLVYALAGRVSGILCEEMSLKKPSDGDWPSYSIYDALNASMEDLGVTQRQQESDSAFLQKKVFRG